MTDAKDRIFVFGSNLAGRHGAGAARRAYEHYGAPMGLGDGQISTRAYAIPTKGLKLEVLSLDVIELYVSKFIHHAWTHAFMDEQGRNFNVTQIGCGLAGLEPRQIAPMFIRAPENCWFDEAWAPWLRPRTKFWTREVEVL